MGIITARLEMLFDSILLLLYIGHGSLYPALKNKSVEPLSSILTEVVEDLDRDKLLIILHTRLDMEYSPEKLGLQHNQCTSGKYIRNPSVFETSTFL